MIERKSDCSRRLRRERASGGVVCRVCRRGVYGTLCAEPFEQRGKRGRASVLEQGESARELCRTRELLSCVAYCIANDK